MFAYTIIYVADVPATVAFYEQAFGLQRRFVDDTNNYAEMETGGTALAFAADAMAELNGLIVRPNRPGEPASGIEIAFVSDDPGAAWATAVAAGATPAAPVTEKPWGQKVGHVRDLNGVLVELCSPVG